MRFDIRRFQLFGLNLALPIISRVHMKLDADRAALLGKYRKQMGDCKLCHKLVSFRAANSFLAHMQDDHGIDAEDSYEIIADVYRQMHAQKIARQGWEEVNEFSEKPVH